MGKTRVVCSAAAVLAGGALALSSASEYPRVVQAAPADDATKLAYYTGTVKPILQSNCWRCHSGMNRRGGFQMDTRAVLLKGGKDGVAVVPGNAEASLMVKLIRHANPTDDPGPMPPRGKLSDADVAAVTRWVNEGALMDR